MSTTLSRRALFGRPSTRDAGPRVAAVGGGCVAARGIACSSCSDPCEPRALRVRPLPGGRALPVIDTALCTGCGDCVRVCPVDALALVPAPAREDEACA